MEDFISKGIGASVFIKTVANAMTLYDTHEKLMQALVDGTFTIDRNGLNPAGVEQMGTRLGKATLLSDTTVNLLGGGVSLPDDALQQLLLLIRNGSLYRIHATFSDGTPASGIAIKNLKLTYNNSMAYTGANGEVIGYADGTTATFSLGLNYADISATPVTVTAIPNTITQVNMTIEKVDFKSFTTSTPNIAFSPHCTRVDVSMNGGGGGGGASNGRGGNGGGGGSGGAVGKTPSTMSYNNGGGGGGSGGVTIIENAPFTPNTNYNLIVGNSGAKGELNSINGKAGGASSFLGISSTGNYENGHDGSTSSRWGGSGGTPTLQIYSSFTSTKLKGKGGEGGDGSSKNGTYNPDSNNGKPGEAGEVAIRMWH